MADLTRKLHFFSTQRRRGFCILLLVFAPLVSCIRLDSGQYRSKPSSFLTIPRGGDSNGRNLDEDSYDDDEERTRFWSLTSLFRLNANAKDDASTATPSSHLQRGNKRGGALAVRTSKSNTFVDVTPVSTASSRLIEDEVSDRSSDDDEPSQPLGPLLDDNNEEDKYVEGISEVVEVDEIEVLDALEADASGEEESDEDIQPTSTASTADSRLTEAKSQNENGEAKGDELEDEDTVGSVQEMSGVEILEKIRADESAEASGTHDDERAMKEPGSSDQETIESGGMLEDTSKLWWTNVWTEQTSGEIPELEELVSDESDAEDEDLHEPPIQSDEVEIVNEVDVYVQEVELEETQEHSQTLEVVDVEVISEAPEVPSKESLQSDVSKEIITDVDGEPGLLPKEESPFASSGYVRMLCYLLPAPGSFVHVY